MSNLPANTDHLKQYEQRMIRTHWDEAEEKWYFAIVDVIAVLTDSVDPQNYWRVLKKRLRDEGNETITNCNGLQTVEKPSFRVSENWVLSVNGEKRKKKREGRGNLANHLASFLRFMAANLSLTQLET